MNNLLGTPAKVADPSDVAALNGLLGPAAPAPSIATGGTGSGQSSDVAAMTNLLGSSVSPPAASVDTPGSDSSTDDSALDNLLSKLSSAKDAITLVRDQIHDAIQNVDLTGLAIGLLDSRVSDARETVAGLVPNLSESKLGAWLADAAADRIQESSLDVLGHSPDAQEAAWRRDTPNLPVSFTSVNDFAKTVMGWITDAVSSSNNQNNQ
jgi:hypothetical protein